MAVYVYDDDMVQHKVLNAWYSDGVKNRQVRCMWVGDVDGTLRKSDDCIGAVQVDVVTLSHTAFRVSWSAPAAVLVKIRRWTSVGGAGFITIGQYDTPTGYADFSGYNPDQAIQVSAYATDAAGNSAQSARDLTYLSSMPAPASCIASNATTSSYDLAWSSVASASRYDVYNGADNTLQLQTTATSWARGGLNMGTAYYNYVKAVHSSGATSAASPMAGITTVSRFPAGTYYFYAHSCDTWQMSARTWRGTSAGIVWHGDGGTFGAAGGSRQAFFFDYREVYTGQTITQYFSGPPANVTKVQIRTMRSASQHGIWSPQTCRYQRHNHASRPASPTGIHEYVQPGTLNLGENKWFDLPVHWGSEWIAGMWTMGMIWGGTPYYSNGAGYMYGPDLAHMGNQCEVAITVS